MFHPAVCLAWSGACCGADITVGIRGVNDSVTDRLQTLLSRRYELREHRGDQGQGRPITGGCGDGPGRIHSLASGALFVPPQGSPVCGRRNRVRCQQARLSQLQAVRSEEVPAECRAGRTQGQVIQSHKVASSESSGWQESEPGSAWRESSPGLGSPPE